MIEQNNWLHYPDRNLTIFDTGLDEQGNPLPLKKEDPHWFYRNDQNKWVNAFTCQAPPISRGTGWIWMDERGTPATREMVFRTPFTIPRNCDPQTVKLKGVGYVSEQVTNWFINTFQFPGFNGPFNGSSFSSDQGFTTHTNYLYFTVAPGTTPQGLAINKLKLTGKAYQPQVSNATKKTGAKRIIVPILIGAPESNNQPLKHGTIPDICFKVPGLELSASDLVVSKVVRNLEPTLDSPATCTSFTEDSQGFPHTVTSFFSYDPTEKCFKGNIDWEIDTTQFGKQRTLAEKSKIDLAESQSDDDDGIIGDPTDPESGLAVMVTVLTE